METVPQVSIVIPALNEELALPGTLKCVNEAQRRYSESRGVEAEVLVVDNGSTDRTRDIAMEYGARLISEPRRGIGFARNAGAASARAPWLFFCDADTLVPPEIVEVIHDTLTDKRCHGGAPITRYEYKKRLLRPHMELWKLVASLRNMTQGVGQFVTAEAFRAIGGYPTDLQMAEDTEFYWRLRRYAGWQGGYTMVLKDTPIVPSSRRLDQWPIWRTVLMTNPITTRLRLKSARFWSSWRDGSVR